MEFLESLGICDAFSVTYHVPKLNKEDAKKVLLFQRPYDVLVLNGSVLVQPQLRGERCCDEDEQHAKFSPPSRIRDLFATKTSKRDERNLRNILCPPVAGGNRTNKARQKKKKKVIIRLWCESSDPSCLEFLLVCRPLF
ncbi:unnamed protein product [Musa acuminata subsp. malaccensis]|uniref:(wild Malaysian banana) hypothetical protein n=1 Tax=Musa acuminata subsp. malaccensis TaxID=214687 RepID=A0A804JL88_MUSAM|nr:unnamed protein product [Musa acuminata subsp. malaccensis]